jgi:uncharacterized protein (DUF362 family)
MTVSSTPGRERQRAVWLGSINDGYQNTLPEALSWLGAGAVLKPGCRVLVKPNLTFPEYRPGVMTSPDCIEALIVALKDYTDQITIGESDGGGYNRFSMSEVFNTIGLKDMAARYGVKLVNFSDLPGQIVEVKSGWRTLNVSLPATLADADAFISMPVPKVHANTGISLSMKNLWGLIQVPADRLKLHPFFTDVIHAITRALPPSFGVVDGRFGLTRNGPMRGDPVRPGWIAVGNDLCATDVAGSALMGVPFRSIPHLRTIAGREGLRGVSQVQFNRAYEEFVAAEPFYLRREWTDLPGYATFHSRGLAWLGYESPLAAALHRLLYRFREPFY